MARGPAGCDRLHGRTPHLTCRGLSLDGLPAWTQSLTPAVLWSGAYRRA